MSDTESEFDPRAAEAPAHVGLEARVAAIEAHLGIGEAADADTEDESAEGESADHEGA